MGEVYSKVSAMSLRPTLAKRHAQHYLDLLNAVNIQYILGEDAIPPAVSTFDTEFEQIQEAQSWASLASSSDDEAATMAEDFVDRGADLLLLRLPMASYQEGR